MNQESPDLRPTDNNQPAEEKKTLRLTGLPKAPVVAHEGVPRAIDVEKSILALVTTDPVTYIDNCKLRGVNKDFFYLPAHQLLWEIFESRYAENQPLDIISVSQYLQDSNELDAVGGISGLAQIYSFTTTGAFFEYHIQILRDKYMLRSLIDISNKTIESAYSWNDEVPILLDSVETSVLKVREVLDRGGEKRTIAVITDEAITRLEQMLVHKGEVVGLATGFDVLDRMTNGLKGGDMFVVAARPSMGKTSFLLNIVEHVALEQHKKTLMFSCEMPDGQIVERLLFARSGVRRNEVMSNGLNKQQTVNIFQVVKELKEAQLVIDDTAGISINELRARARRVMRELGGLDLIGIDYLQLMHSYTRQAQNSREREIAEISAGLKALAKELKVPVIVLAQLNRGPENRTGKSKGVPQMSDLRESGAIEQDADMIGLLYRSAYYAEDEEERQKHGGHANLYLAKNRNGATGDVPLHFEAELMRFSPRERDEHDAEE